MGRLIDGTIQALPMSNYILERKDTFIRVLENGDNDFLFAMLMDYFDKQPTAYDVDAVVGKLEEKQDDIQGNMSLHNFYSEGYSNAINDAIDIVRKGGIDG